MSPGGLAATRAALALLIVLHALVVIRNAWLCDDAYITYRTVDNFVAGLGLRWNVDERVQAYTHPLWMFVIAAGYRLSGNIYWTALATSVACSLLAVVWVAARVAVSAWGAALAVCAVTLSSAFVDYSTSGLENPLTHLLLAGFLVRFLCRPLDGANLGVLSLIASLAAVNRLDTLLLYLPALSFALVRFRSWRGLAIVAVGFLPLAAWELFSLVYYGFLFPNTAYAKLKLFLPREEVVAQGLRYLENSLRLDPVTLLSLAAGGVLALRRGARRGLPVFAGAALYLGYVVSVGGDFMAGRLLTAPLLCGVALLARADRLRRWSGAIALVTLLGIGLAAPNPSFLSGFRERIAYAELIEPNGIADERRFYDPFTGLRSYAVHGGVPAHEWTRQGESLRRADVPLVLMSFNGFYGFAAGPGVHIVDQHGLSEPLLARIPPPYRPDWRIGHVWRELPEGYWETLRTGLDQMADADLARYRAELLRITRGRIWSTERWGAIFGMALGRYEHLIDVQRYRFPPAPSVPQASLAEPRAPGSRTGASGTTLVEWPGLDVVLPQPSHAGRIEVGVDGNDAWALVYFRGAQDLAISKLPRRPGSAPGLEPIVADVPRSAAEAGFDRVRVIPYGGDGRSAIGQLRPL